MNTITATFDVSRDQDRVDGTASRQWATRPMDERFATMDDLITTLRDRTERSTQWTTKLADLRPVLSDAGTLAFDMVNQRMQLPTNYAFSQICAEAGAPASYIRKLPDDLAVKCLQYGMKDVDPNREVGVMTTRSNNIAMLRALTGPKYGRIWDLEVAEAVKRMTDESGTRWEVPTAFLRPGQENRAVEVTKESTTLYAGDRDIFMFLVDQSRPIEAGLLPDGTPDLYFRGFYAYNGECGGVANGIGTFLYRYVCMNRNIWGQRGFQKISIRHTANAAARFVSEALPALETFVNGSTAGVVDGLLAAKRTRIARTDDDRLAFLLGLDFAPKAAATILGRVIDEEGHPAETAWDFAQGITAFARSIPHQDERTKIEAAAGKLLAEVA